MAHDDSKLDLNDPNLHMHVTERATGREYIVKDGIAIEVPPGGIPHAHDAAARRETASRGGVGWSPSPTLDYNWERTFGKKKPIGQA